MAQRKQQASSSNILSFPRFPEKRYVMGLVEYLVSEPQVEQGYEAGRQAHLDFMRSKNLPAPVMLDETQFALVLDRFFPGGMTRQAKGVWRAHFIAGWTSIYLGFLPADVAQQLQHE